MTFPARTLLLASLALLLAATPAAAAPGDLDLSFGAGDGAVDVSPRDGAWFGSFALDGDRIVVAGSTRMKTADCQGDDLALARLLRDGTPDPGFGTGGVAVSQAFACDPHAGRAMSPRALAVAPDGRAFTAGWAQPPNDFNGVGWVSAHTPTGAFDTSFDGDGFVTDAEIKQGTFVGLTRLDDGRLVAVGHETRLASSWEARGYLPNGSPDPSFGGGDGVAGYKFVAAPTHETVSAVVADGDDGSMVVAGTVPEADGNVSGASVARILSGGALDATFGDGGRAQLAGVSIRDLVRTSDGGFVAAGAAGGSAALIKLDAAGTVDQTFGAAGIAAGPVGRAFAIAEDAEDRLLVAGAEDGGDTYVARYLINGALDATFGDGGFVRNVPVAEVLVQPDGRIVLGGTTTSDGRDSMTIVRLLGDDPDPGSDEEDGEIGGDDEFEGTDDEGEADDPEEDVQAGRVSIRILTARINRRGVLVRATWPEGTDGRARARLWTRNKGILLGQRRVRARPGKTGRTFRVPLNRRAKRMLAGGKRLKVTATVRVTGLPE